MTVALNASSITGASNISASGTTYGLTIDSNGYTSKPLTPCYQGYINPVYSAGLPYGTPGIFTASGGTTYGFSQGITVNEATATFTVPVAGMYTLYVQQLVRVTGALYLYLRRNGTSFAHGYVNEDMCDIRCTLTISCAANDTLDFYYGGGGTLNESWGGSHSSIFLYQIG